jgi:DNA polymerase-3 subunit gamma/tau
MSNLNLARKLRPKNFDEIIGQDLSVSMLKNSLYLKKLFPVYLFSGQRGCGKTSTARVFAAAVNCKKLPNFQENATNTTIPCLTCESCKSMLESNHPDFIEMDAASHTGVDSVRQIIESCTYMPLAGEKKIYLIDEAHMLSKAAFNAFLKILEEPPTATIFILATTEIQKIPDTVRSRCFQVLFNPVKNDILFSHIKSICNSEQIDADDDAISLLVQENDGSVRDTINTLEQVRFSGEKVSKDLVLRSLGKIGETQLNKLLELIINQKPKE